MFRYWFIGIAAVLSALLVITWLLPLPKTLLLSQIATTKILDRNGMLLYEQRAGGLQEDIALEDVPQEIIHALIATEDRSFWTNGGISMRGIARAFVRDIEAGHIVEGGSTITQQLVRSNIKPESRGFSEKIREVWLALKLTSRQSKHDILEQYLNTAYFGQQSYGIVAAAKTYFGKNLSELSLGESALLVGLLNAPTSLNPFKDIASATERRSVVLGAMRETSQITLEEQNEADHEQIHLAHGKALIKAPHFVLWQIAERGDEWKGADEVRTTIDLGLQTEVEQIVANQLEKLKDRSVTSAAVVVLDARTGDMLSMLGSGDYFDAEHDGQVNVTLSPRQPGSAIKPFTYALALSRGMTAASTVADVESEFLTQEGTSYTPRNYDYHYHGLVRLREALGNSYNIAAIKVLQSVGVPALLNFLQNLGLTTLTQSPEHYGLALTLGDSEVKLLELARAYGIFARGGKTLELRTLLSGPIHDGKQVLDPKVAWLIADILSDNDARAAEFGRSSPLSFSFPVAAKTGTTRNARDNWTIGFTPSRIVGVWVGNADNAPMRGTSGITGAAPIFRDVMLASLRGQPREHFMRPEGIVDREVCRLSGKLMSKFCPKSLTEHFIEGTEPKDHDDLFRQVHIDLRNGLLAGTGCALRFTENRVFAFFPPELRKWARDNGWPMPPEKLSPLCRNADHASSSVRTESWLTITSPQNGASYKLDPLVPDEHEQILFEVSADAGVAAVEWSVNGRRVGSAQAPDFHFLWKPSPGLFRIQAVAGARQDSVRMEVKK